MMPADAFKVLLSRVNSSLRGLGYKRSGLRFCLQKQGNWGVLGFQKSARTDQRRLIFTINVGVCSTRLLRFYSLEKVGNCPTIQDCHLDIRLGHLLPDRDDKWWTIVDEKGLDQLSDEIVSDVTNVAHQMICHHVRDEDLMALWLSGRSPGLTDLQRLKNLSVLLKAEQDPRFDLIMGEMRKLAERDPNIRGAVLGHFAALMESEQTY